MIFPLNVLLSVILNFAIKYCYFFLGGTSPDTENDFLLAQMMQLEYDKEYDRTIDSMEKRYNGESKGIKIRTGGKCKFMQCCNYLLKLFHIKTVIIIIKLLGINLRSPLGYQVIQFYQLTELTM